jgi:hypothetical protein
MYFSTPKTSALIVPFRIIANCQNNPTEMDTSKIISAIKSGHLPAYDKAALLKSYPEPVQRFLRFHLPEGIPARSYAQVRLKGIIKLVNWSYFKSTLYVNPFRGFCWQATVKMGLLPVKGYDYFLERAGAMQWRIFNLIPVMKAANEDVSRSAEGRAKLESAMFPDLLIHPQVKWKAFSDTEITATWKIHQEEQPVHFNIADDGALQEIFMQRWGNPGDTKDFAYHNFGCHIELESLHQGAIIPKKGNAGWWFGDDRYDDGEFFRFERY